MIDGITLTDTITRLFKKGKIANVGVITGAVNDEGATGGFRNLTALGPATNSIWNLTDAQAAQAVSFYPVNATFGFESPDNFFLSYFKASIQSQSPFGEAGITGSERVVGKYVTKAFGPGRVWTFRFNAPGKIQCHNLVALGASFERTGPNPSLSSGVGTNYGDAAYPSSWVAHSADNSYLQNATAVMKPFEKALASEWRAYYRLLHPYWQPKHPEAAHGAYLAQLRLSR